jgi:leukotriene-A4 hydrolase
MRHLLHSFLALPGSLLCALLLPACAGLRSAPSTIIHDDHSFAEPNRVRVTHASLDLTLDFEAKVARGTVTLDLLRRDSGADLIVDTNELVIESVTAPNGTARQWSMGQPLARHGRPLRIHLDHGDERVKIRYRTTPHSEAMQWLGPEQTADGEQPFLFTQGQSILTRSWIPLQDSPGVRITYDARIRCPEGLTVVMSAERLGRDSLGAWRFRLDQAVPPYLIALGCGLLEFRAISERAGVWAEPSVVERALAELEDTELMIQAAEGLFGPYRWGRFDVLVLPPSFPFGGMENPTLTFATPTILAGDKSLVALIAHELAHSWSGNLVTNATWSDFWLNEGFTVYCENRIMEVLYGTERAATERVLEIGELEEEMQTLEPWQQILNTPLEGRHPDDGFSGVPYTKGALFLSRLEQLAGRAQWDAYLRDYFDRHAFQSITTRDFLQDLAWQLPDAYHEIDADLWTEKAGLPDDAPRPVTESLTVVDSQVALLASGTSAGELSTDGWSTQQWLRFLRALPQSLDAEGMADLDQAFGFTRSGNSEILCQWLQLSILRGYGPADGRLEEFLHDVGRRKFLKPLYTALQETNPQRAREIYDRNRARYHSVSTGTLDGIVDGG